MSTNINIIISIGIAVHFVHKMN